MIALTLLTAAVLVFAFAVCLCHAAAPEMPEPPWQEFTSADYDRISRQVRMHARQRRAETATRGESQTESEVIGRISRKETAASVSL